MLTNPPGMHEMDVVKDITMHSTFTMIRVILDTSVDVGMAVLVGAALE